MAVERGVGELDDDLIDAVTTEVLEVVDRDADGSPWIGEAHLMNDNAAKKSERVLTSVKLRVNEGYELATAETEAVAVLQTVRVFMADMLDKMVKVMGAAAARESAMATMVESVAKWSSKGESRDAKYDWKAKKAEQETERQRIAEIGKTQRQKERWAGLADLGTEYKDVVSAWSDLLLELARDVKQNAVAPTLEDVNFVFVEHDDLRALAAEMVSTADQKARLKLGAKFKRTFLALDVAAQRAIGARAMQRLGSLEAMKAALAWLVRPMTAPSGVG